MTQQTQTATKTGAFKPTLQLSTDHDLCPGCGEPLVLRSLLEVIEELGLAQRAIGVMGIGCSTALASLMDLDLIQALHGRAPSVATGAKRMRPDSLLFTIQGDGDMANEGLQEVIHTAARAENVTCVLLNNGVFGETGGHMTATTAPGQRTKTSLEGRDPAYHGHPILMTDLIGSPSGTAFAARGSVHNAHGLAATKRMPRRASPGPTSRPRQWRQCPTPNARSSNTSSSSKPLPNACALVPLPPRTAHHGSPGAPDA